MTKMIPEPSRHFFSNKTGGDGVLHREVEINFRTMVVNLYRKCLRDVSMLFKMEIFSAFRFTEKFQFPMNATGLVLRTKRVPGDG